MMLRKLAWPSRQPPQGTPSPTPGHPDQGPSAVGMTSGIRSPGPPVRRESITSTVGVHILAHLSPPPRPWPESIPCHSTHTHVSLQTRSPYTPMTLAAWGLSATSKGECLLVGPTRGLCMPRGDARPPPQGARGHRAGQDVRMLVSVAFAQPHQSPSVCFFLHGSSESNSNSDSGRPSLLFSRSTAAGRACAPAAGSHGHAPLSDWDVRMC